MPYPPTIRHADYASPPAPALNLVAPCPLHAAPECSLEELTLHVNRHVVGGTSFHQAHGDLAAGAAGRRRFAPGVDQLHVNWRFEGAVHVVGARLDLSYLGDAGMVPLWTKALTWGAGQCPAIGGTPFSGRLDDNAPERAATGAANVAIVFAPDAAFPTDHLNVQQAPYKLEMTITSVDGATVRTRTRWIYLDVEVADLTLELGPERLLTARAAHGAAVDPRFGFDRRNRELRARMEAALGGGPASMRAADHAAIDIPLDGSLFGASSAEWDDNSFYQAWRARWDDGPYIPLVVRARVYNEAGAPVPARLALGGARFLWDWEGAAVDLTHVHALSQGDITAAYQINLAQWPTGAENASTGIGGKRGGAAALFRHGDVGHQHYANGGARHFPFAMAPCAARRGAIWSSARTDDDDYGSHTGAIFTPSRVAQDRFTLTVYFAYGARAAWDVDSTAGVLRGALPYPVPSVTSGRLTVQREVRIARWWRHNNTVQGGAFAWANVARDLRQSGVTLDAAAAAAPTNIDALHFQQAFYDVVQALPNAKRCFFAPRDQQAAADKGYGIKLRTYDQFRTEVLQRYTTRLATLAMLARPQNGGDAAALDRIEARAEVYLQLVNDLPSLVPIVQAIDILGRPLVWPNNGAITTWADTQLQMLLPAPGVSAAIATNPRAGGDQTAIRELIRLAGVTSDNYKDLVSTLGNEVLTQVCAKISAQDAPDEDGLQVFQFDFEDNFDQFSASGWAFDTPSNRAHCPECNTPLAAPDRAARLCPNGACAVRLRSNASIMTLVPWRYMAGFNAGVWAGLQANKAKYFVLTNMQGTRPEILVVHEMGHHLCLPHSPHGFNLPAPVPGGVVWSLLSTAINNNQGVRDQLIAGTVPGGNVPTYHATNHRACIMGYNFAEMQNLHYCFKCTLRMRGWDGDHVRLL